APWTAPCKHFGSLGRRVGEQRRGDWLQGGHCELGDRGQRYRSCADGEIEFRLVELLRMFGIGQRAVEDLDDLRRAELPRVVFDLGRAVARAGLVAVDTEHAHQLALDCLAQGSLAAERRVVELD